MVDASGVLHHMADPRAGLHVLLAAAAAGWFDAPRNYSEAGRRNCDCPARKYVADKRLWHQRWTTFGAARQDLLNSNLRSVGNIGISYSTNECRDLLFHVQEARLNIPVLKAFIAKHGLKFLGFEFGLPALQQYRNLFASSGWAWTDFDRWHAFETPKSGHVFRLCISSGFRSPDGLG